MSPLSTSPPSCLVYKVFLPEQFEVFCAQGAFGGSPDDLRDGFIHLSFAAQLRKTISKHFAGRPDLRIAEFQSEHLAPLLRFEVSRDEQLFPHLYDVLRWDLMLRCVPLDEVG